MYTEIIINIINSISISFAFGIIIKKYCCLKFNKRFLFYILILIIDNLLFIFFIKETAIISLYLMPLITYFYLRTEKYDRFPCLYFSINTILIIVLITMFIGCLLFLIFYNLDLRSKLSYNSFMSISIVIFSFVYGKLINRYEIKFYNKTIIIEIVIKFAIFYFIGYKLPKLPIVEDSYSFNTISMWIFFFIISFVAVNNYIHVLQIREIKASIDNEVKKHKLVYLNEQKEKFDIYNHYVLKLISSIMGYIYKNDINGLKLFYEKQLQPIKESILQQKVNDLMLENIENEILYNLLLDCINNFYGKENIRFDIKVKTPIKFICLDDLSLFKICNIFIQNALEEVEIQRKGYIRINLSIDTEGTFIFIVENSILNNDSSIKQNHSGKGHRIAREIEKRNSNINIHIYKKNEKFVQILEVEI